VRYFKSTTFKTCILEIRQKYLYIKKVKKMNLAMKKCAGRGDGTFAIFPIEICDTIINNEETNTLLLIIRRVF